MEQPEEPGGVATAPHVLVVDAPGLEDVAALSRDHGAIVERIPEVDLGEADLGNADLLVCPAPLVPALPPAPPSGTGVCVAVLAAGDTTTQAEIPSGWRGFLIRRPVHPAALRLLVGYLLYRGPERRREHRVTVGSRIRLRVGGAPRFATLLDLSAAGCRVAAPLALPAGARVGVEFPEPVTRRRPLRLDAEVIRVARAPDAAGSAHPGSEVALRFGPMPAAARSELRRIASLYLRGPALEESLAGVRLRDLAPELAERAAQVSGRTASAGECREPGERRGEPRVPYRRRVIARGRDGVRVLLGSDISPGGMRVRSQRELRVGDEIRIAVYLAPGVPPLVLDAEVCRRGAGGIYGLRFLHREPETAARLRALAGRFSSFSGGSEQTGVVPAELLG